MALKFLDIIDKPEWRPIAQSLNAHAAGGGLAFDLRNNDTRFLGIFQLASATVFNMYNPANDGPSFVGSPGLAGAFGAGTSMVFAPSHGPRGTIAAGATTSSFTPSATLGATIPKNKLGSRGIVGKGFRVRIIDNVVGGSGKTEERTILANTSSTTPLIYLDSPLSFTPTAGATFEILSGRVYMINAYATLAAGVFKYFDLATNLFSGNLATTNLPAALATDSQLISLDELYVPSNRTPGLGFLNSVTATAANATTITAGTLASAVGTNQFRNFQLRIVEDATAPTAVGQRQIITSHTSGTTPVFTIQSTWTVQPSATAKFVIELPNEIVLTAGGQTATFTYAPYAIRYTANQAADSWSSTRYGARTTAPGAGTMAFCGFGFPIFDTTKDPSNSHQHGLIHSFRGGGSTALDTLDIAGGATGLWTNAAAYNAIGTTFTTGSSIAYDPVGEDGRWAYINLNGTQFMYRFSIFSQDMCEWAYFRQTQGTAAVGNRMYTGHALDTDSNKLGVVGHLQASGSIMHECIIST